MARILSVENDPALQHLLSLVLREEGYDLYYAFSGDEGWEKFLALDPDAILLDLVLPGLNGAELLGRIRRQAASKGVPAIVMAAHTDDARFLEQRVRRLAVAAYLLKPVCFDELKAVLRRLVGSAPREPAGRQAEKGPIRIDVKFRSVWADDRLIGTLPPMRFELLRALLESEGSVRREDLIRRLWGHGNPNGRILDKTIQRLREDLGPTEGRRIQTTLSGYELVAETDAAPPTNGRATPARAPPFP